MQSINTSCLIWRQMTDKQLNLLESEPQPEPVEPIECITYHSPEELLQQLEDMMWYNKKEDK